MLTKQLLSLMLCYGSIKIHLIGDLYSNIYLHEIMHHVIKWPFFKIHLYVCYAHPWHWPNDQTQKYPLGNNHPFCHNSFDTWIPLLYFIVKAQNSESLRHAVGLYQNLSIHELFFFSYLNICPCKSILWHKLPALNW